MRGSSLSRSRQCRPQSSARRTRRTRSSPLASWRLMLRSTPMPSRVVRTIAFAALSGCIGTCEPTPPATGPDATAVRDAASDAKATKHAAAVADAGVDAAGVIDRGHTLYGRYCDFCHGKEGLGYAAD